jgi:hypothetical protein
MNKADYIHLFKEACGGRCNAEYNPCIYRQAADNLAALKPVGWKCGNQIGVGIFKPDYMKDAQDIYAFEERT